MNLRTKKDVDNDADDIDADNIDVEDIDADDIDADDTAKSLTLVNLFKASLA